MQYNLNTLHDIVKLGLLDFTEFQNYIIGY